MIEIADYDDEWPARFANLRAELSATLASRGVPFVAIEHVGSTSVPGLAAKPVIDCDIIVTADSVPSASAALVADGFEALGDLGVPLRWAFAPPPHLARTNVYVTVQGSLSLRNHLAVRDVLRRRPDLRDAYADAKRRAAGLLPTSTTTPSARVRWFKRYFGPLAYRRRSAPRSWHSTPTRPVDTIVDGSAEVPSYGGNASLHPHCGRIRG